MDVAGKIVVLRERAAISSKVFQPIRCCGRLLENGWGIDGQQQVLIHRAGVNVLIEMQNKPVTRLCETYSSQSDARRGQWTDRLEPG